MTELPSQNKIILNSLIKIKFIVKSNVLTHSLPLARQHGATSHAGDALGRQSSMISKLL